MSTRLGGAEQIVAETGGGQRKLLIEGRILYPDFWVFLSLPAEVLLVTSVCLRGFLDLLGLYHKLMVEPVKKQTPAQKMEEFILVIKTFFSKTLRKEAL